MTIVPCRSSQSRTMVEAGKKAGAEIVYVEVPGGSHVSVAAPAFAADARLLRQAEAGRAELRVAIAVGVSRVYNRRMPRFTRRQLLAAAPFLAAAAPPPPGCPSARPSSSACCPGRSPVLDRFQMARDAGSKRSNAPPRQSRPRPRRCWPRRARCNCPSTP